jgi:hypothetical protein
MIITRYKLFLLVAATLFCMAATAQTQSLKMFEVGHADEQIGSFSYFEPVTLSQGQIVHSYLYTKRHATSQNIFGDVKIHTYSTTGTLLEQESSSGDSLFITKTILKSNGERILLGNMYKHLALYNLDTLSTTAPANEYRSFVLHLDPANQTLHYEEFAPVQDMALDTINNLLYLVEQSTYNTAKVYAYNLTSGHKSIIANIGESRYNPRIMLTPRYVYVCGSSINYGVKVNGQMHSTSFPYATYVIQLARDGSFNWVNIIKDVTTPHMGMAPAPGQGIYLCSDLQDGVKIGADSLLGPTWGGDFLLTRIDSSGNYVWATEAPNNTLCGYSLGRGFFIDSDQSFNIYIAGASRSILKWDDGLEIGRDSNIIVPTMLMYDSTGIVRHHIIASAGEQGSFFSVDVEANGDFALNGKISNTLTFDSLTHTVTDGGWHPYFLYYQQPVVLTGFGTQKRSAQLSVYPNPANGNGILSVSRTNTEITRLEIYTTTGKKIREYNIGNQTGLQLPLHHLQPGIYLLRSGSQWTKLVIR